MLWWAHLMFTCKSLWIRLVFALQVCPRCFSQCTCKCLCNTERYWINSHWMRYPCVSANSSNSGPNSWISSANSSNSRTNSWISLIEGELIVLGDEFIVIPVWVQTHRIRGRTDRCPCLKANQSNSGWAHQYPCLSTNWVRNSSISLHQCEMIDFSSNPSKLCTRRVN